MQQKWWGCICDEEDLRLLLPDLPVRESTRVASMAEAYANGWISCIHSTHFGTAIEDGEYRMLGWGSRC